MYFFMKKEYQWSPLELDVMSPLELEIFYYQSVADYKERKGVA